MCQPEDVAKCREEFGRHLAWNCENCPKKRPADLHPWTLHLLKLRRLQTGGYPFAANDLDMDVWIDLGRINEWLQTPAL